MPAELAACFVAIQPQKLCLMRSGRVGLDLQFSFSPSRNYATRELGHRDSVLLDRAEIPSTGAQGAFFEEPLPKQEVRPYRFEHMLPRTNRIGPTNDYRAAGTDAADDVRHQSVFRPVSS